MRLLWLAAAAAAAPSSSSNTNAHSSSSNTNGPRKISDVTVLLPSTIGHRRVSYRLQAWGGSYEWFSTNPTVIEVQSQDSESAKISAIGGAKDGRSIIIAKDKVSKQELRCEVYVGTIHRLEIITTSRTISVEDYEILSVNAFDKESNVFSSLEGLEFSWHNENQSVLQQTSLRETEFKLSPGRRLLEEDNKSGDLIMVQGKATGKTQLFVKYNSIVSPTTNLTVSEHLILVPTMCYTLPQSQIQFGVKVMKGQDSLEDTPMVELPSSYLEFDGTDISVDPKNGGSVTSPVPGVAKVNVNDLRIDGNSASSILVVRAPAKLQMSVRPATQLKTIPVDPLDARALEALYTRASNWNFVQTHEYWLYLEVKDNEANSYCLPSNLETNFFCKAEPCLLKKMPSPRQWAVPFVAQTIGQGTLGFKGLVLPYDKKKTVKYDLETSITFNVHSMVKLPHKVLVLAPQHTFQIVATGGSNNYLWRSSNESFAVIGPDGVATALRIGMTTITVQDQANSDNVASLLLYIRPWSHNTFGKRKAAVPRVGIHYFPIYAVPKMEANEDLPYFCNATAYAPDSVLGISSWMATLGITKGPHGCAEVSFKPEQVGNVHVTAYDNEKDNTHAAEIDVVIYDPMWLYFIYKWPLRNSDMPPLKLDKTPMKGFALSVGSAVEITFRDGPRDPNVHWTMTSDDSIGPCISIEPTSAPDTFLIRCHKVGSGELLGQVSASKDGKVIATASGTLLCGQPKQARIFSVEHVSRLPINDLEKQLSAVVDMQHPFALIPYTTAGIPLADNRLPTWSSDLGDMPKGTLFVGAHIYKKEFEITSYLDENKKLNDTVRLKGAHQFVVEWPAMPSTHFLTGSDYVFSVREGSAWDLKWNLTDVKFAPQSNEVTKNSSVDTKRCNVDAGRKKGEECRGEWSLLSKNEGPFKVSIEDEGLLGSKPVKVEGTIYPLRSIIFPKKRNHQEVKSTHELKLRLLDTKGHDISHELWPMSKIECESLHLSVTKGPDHVKVKGEKVGTFDLRCGIRGTDLWSPKIEIVVFSPFRLYPEVLVALPNRDLTAEFQVTGGFSDSVIFYHSSHTLSVTVEANGRLTFLKPGNSTITATLAVPNAGTVIAQATAEVIVGEAAKAEIRTASTLVDGQAHAFSAHLFTKEGHRLTPALLAFPEEGKPFCDFAWRAENVVFVDYRDETAKTDASTNTGAKHGHDKRNHGLVGRGLNSVTGRVESGAKQAVVSVEVRCDKTGPLQASRKTPVLKHSGGCYMCVPLESQVDMAMLGIENKANEIVISQNGAAFYVNGFLEVGPELAEGLIVSRQSGTTTSLLAISARQLEEVHFVPAVTQLPLGSSADVTLQFVAEARKMAFPSKGVDMQLYSSHSSILKVTHLHNQCRIEAKKGGCAGIQIVANHGKETVFGVMRVCTALDALVPVSPIVMPGAEVNFFLEKASFGVKEYRIQLVDATESQVTDFFAKEMAMVLNLSPTAITVTSLVAISTRLLVTFEVDPSSGRTLSSTEWSTQSVAERMWASTARLGSFLRAHWDRDSGILPISKTPSEVREALASRTVVTQEQGGDALESSSTTAPSGVRGEKAKKKCDLWSSSDTGVVKFSNPREGHAIAVGFGTATITYCGDFEQHTVVTVAGVHRVQAPDSITLQNFGTGAIIIPLKLFEETRMEVTNSAFVSQRLNVVCVLDSLMQNFFEVSTRYRTPDEDLACVLRRLPSPVGRVLARGALAKEGSINVEIRYKKDEPRYKDSHTLYFPFVPAFVLLDGSGRELDTSIPLLLTNQRVQSFRIWTGGSVAPTVKVTPSTSNIRVLMEQATPALISVQVILEGDISAGTSLLIEGSKGQVEMLPLEISGFAGPTGPTVPVDTVANYIPWWVGLFTILVAFLAGYLLLARNNNEPRPRNRYIGRESPFKYVGKASPAS